MVEDMVPRHCECMCVHYKQKSVFFAFKTRGNEQGSLEVLASLKLLLSGLSKVQSLLSNAKVFWGVEKIGLDKRDTSAGISGNSLVNSA